MRRERRVWWMMVLMAGILAAAGSVSEMCIRDRSYHTAESAFVRTIDIFVFHASVAGLKKR